ncbi:MAG: hypothetical protein DCC55_40035 [Chloroflexi bacterium]|nr:MAG: hypothetical protein DCC55_40035 [Chloroflexota bacterium]
MEEYTKTKADISQIIERLAFAPCLAFAATCCERLVLNYHAFSVVHHWGDSAPLDKALELIWVSLKTGTFEYNEANMLLNSIEAITPDLEKFNSIYVWQALYAIDAVKALLQYYLSPEKQHIVHISDLSMSAIYHYVQDVAFQMDIFAVPPQKTNELYVWAFTAPIFVTELADQRKTLEVLQIQTHLSIDFLDDLRKTTKRSGINAIARGLVVAPDQL